MKKRLLFPPIIVGLAIFLASAPSNAKEVVFFLIDKSGSMWLQDPASQKSVMELAKERVYQILSQSPPVAGKRQVFIKLFDRRLKIDREIASLGEARELLDPITPKGKTTIGARLEEIRKHLERSGIRNVEIHFFSDLDENEIDGVSMEKAVARLDQYLNKEARNLELSLFYYRWKGVEPKTLDLPAKETFVDLAKPALRLNLEFPGEIVMDFGQGQSGTPDTSVFTCELSGFIAPQLIAKNVDIELGANLEGFDSARVLLDRVESLKLNDYVDPSDGRFAKRIALSIENASADMASLGGDLFRKTFPLVFRVELDPDPQDVFPDFDIMIDREKTVSVKFADQPVLYVKNYPEGTSFFKQGIYQGETIREPLDLAWSLGAVGNMVYWELPRFEGGGLCYLTTPSGVDLTFFPLDEGLGQTVVLNCSNVRGFSGQSIDFELRGIKNARKVSIPAEVEASRPVIDLEIESEIEGLAPSNRFENVREALRICPASGGVPLELELKVAECSGDNCQDLEFEIVDPMNSEPLTRLGGPSATIPVKFPRWLDFRVKAPSEGLRNVSLYASSKSASINAGGKTGNMLGHVVRIHATKPEFSWRIANVEKDEFLGESEGNRLSFSTRGQPVTTADPDLEKAGYEVKAIFTAKTSDFKDAFVKAELRSDNAPEDRLVEAVRFSATGNERCDLKTFLSNPHIVLTMKEIGGFWLGTKKETGKVVFIPYIGGTGGKPTTMNMDNPAFHFEIKMKP